MNEGKLNNTQSSDSNYFIQKLRDPIWQFIGTLLTFLIFLFPFFYAYFFTTQTIDYSENPSKIYITPSYIRRLPDLPVNLIDRAILLIDGKEEKDVHFISFYFQYEGKSSLKQSDFVIPIRGIVPEDRKLIGIQKSEQSPLMVYSRRKPEDENELIKNNGLIKINDQYSFSISSLEYILDEKQKKNRPDKPIDVEITIIDQRTFEIKSPLINPNEWFAIDVYTSQVEQKSKLQEQTMPAPTTTIEDSMFDKSLIEEVTWNCRPIGIQCPSSFVTTPKEYKKTAWYLQFEVFHRGWAIYFIAIFNSFSLLLFLILVSQTISWQIISLRGLILFFGLSLLCLSTAEIIADSLFKINIFNQPPISLIITIVYTGLLLFLSFSFIRNRFINK